ncbi:MAG: PAS domain-containing protein, partial [Flavobacterium sp.]
MDGVTLFSKDLNVFLSASGIGLWYYSASRKAVILDEVAQGIVSAVSESVPVLEFLQHVTTQPASFLLQEIEEKKALTALLYINNSNVILKGQFMESEGWYGGTIQRETCFAAYSAKHDIFRSIIEQAPVATCLFTGPEMRIEIANSIMLDYWGKGASVFGKPLAEALPELEGQPFLDILDHVFTTGETHEETEAMAQLVVNG